MAKRAKQRAPRRSLTGDGPVAPDDIDESFAPRVVDGVVELDVAGDRVVIGGRWGGAQVLNPTAALVWQFLDGEATLGELIDDFSDATGARRKVVKRDVLEFARSLGRIGLLVDVEEPMPELDLMPFEPPAFAQPGEVLESFTLPDLDGHDRALTDYRGRRVLLVNWNPGCGYCEMIAESLAGLEADLARAEVDLVLVSSGDVEPNRALVERAGLEAPVLLKTEGVDPFSGLGTPAATLLDGEGKVAAPLAMGAFDVPALAAELAGVELPTADESHDGEQADGVRYLAAAGGMCGPGAGAAGPSTEWAGTLAFGFGDVHVGIRYNSDDTAALLEKLFVGATIDDPAVPDNYSVALSAPTSGSRELNLLVAGGRQLVRSRSRRRVLAALLSHLSSELTEPDTTLLQVVATPAVRGGEAILLPPGLVGAIKELQPRFARQGIAMVDGPGAFIDVETAELVVPAPRVEHDATVLDDVDADVRLGATELPAVAPGRYPLAGWYLRRGDPVEPADAPGDDDSDRLTPALAVASTISLCFTDDVAATAASLAGLVARVPVRGIVFDSPGELADALAKS